MALLFLTKLVLSIYENDICRIVPLLNFLLLTFFGEERKKERKEIMGGVTILQGYTCIFYLNFAKIWLCHYYFLEVMLQIALSLCSESC